MKILIIGDVMVDVYYESTVTRNAPEADIPIYNIIDNNYILGGASLFNKLKNNVDIMHMFVINNKEGSVKFPKLTMKEWKPIDYKNSTIWSYGHLEKKEIIENQDYLLD